MEILRKLILNIGIGIRRVLDRIIFCLWLEDNVLGSSKIGKR